MLYKYINNSFLNEIARFHNFVTKFIVIVSLCHDIKIFLRYIVETFIIGYNVTYE